MMEEYRLVDPSFPSRILAMAEEEGKERRDLNKSIVRKSYILDIIGNVFGLVAVGGIIWLSWCYLEKGEGENGKSIALGTIVALASIFVLKKIVGSKKKASSSSD